MLLQDVRSRDRLVRLIKMMICVPSTSGSVCKSVGSPRNKNNNNNTGVFEDCAPACSHIPDLLSVYQEGSGWRKMSRGWMPSGARRLYPRWWWEGPLATENVYYTLLYSSSVDGRGEMLTRHATHEGTNGSRAVTLPNSVNITYKQIHAHNVYA